MRVVVAEHAGFCNGVESAVNKALELAKNYGHIYTLGELVHNELVTEFLHSNGVDVVSLDEIDKLGAGEVVLIRAHGVSVEVEQRLKDKGLIVEDATCPVVKRNQMLARERAQSGDDIIIIGDCKHDEVVGLKSYAGENARVIPDTQMPDFGDKNTSILFQTTVLKEKFDKIADFAKKFEKNSHKSVGFFNTICYNTSIRQDEVRALAGTTDAVLVLGSPNSANTRRLSEVAKEVNKNVLFASTADEVRSNANFFKDNQSVSIVAGASTPPWLIREVNKLMSDTQKTAETSAEVEVKKEATLQEQTATEAKEPVTMADLMKSEHVGGSYTPYSVGKRVRGKIVTVGENGLVVNIGGKKDGLSRSPKCPLTAITINPTIKQAIQFKQLSFPWRGILSNSQRKR
ncbi:MAG: 4-hydroxy-3-methylbut-2-enyl diphosphate reductase [Clostridia bacterium]|nr:4-hydroxy-3-methylbut-2-enyl diphosphate reductase [Clostridia bacterium]